MATDPLSAEVRWTRYRWRFVDALIRSARCPGGRPNPACSNGDCCGPLAGMCNSLGIRRIVVDPRSWARLEYLQDLDRFAVDPMHDALWMLGHLYGTGDLLRQDPFAGFVMEPEELSPVIHSTYVTDQRARYFTGSALVSDDYVADVLYCIVAAALPDEWLDRVHSNELTEFNVVVDSTGDDLDTCNAILAVSDDSDVSDTGS